MLRRTLLSRLAGGAALASSVACSSRKQESGPTKIRVLAGRTISMSSLFLAHERGYFKQAGLDVELRQDASSSNGLALLGTGKAEASFASLGVPFLAAMARGLPVKFVAAREFASTKCGTFGSIFGMRKRFPNGLDNPAVLKGKTIGVGNMIGFPQFSLDSHMATAGLSVDSIIPRTMRSPEAIAAVISGSLDACVMNWDFDKNLERVMADTVRTPPLAHYHPNFQISFIYFGPALLDADPAIGGRFMAAYLRAAREFAAGATPEYMKNFGRENASDTSKVTGTCRDTLTVDGHIDMKSLQTLSAWAYKRKYLSEPFDPSKHVDTRFLEHAHAS